MDKNTDNAIENLKKLEGKVFPTETQLFDSLVEAGISNMGDYRSGSRNKTIAREITRQYIDYCKTTEIDPACTQKRSYTITEVYDTPREREDNRGKDGRYIRYLRPLIIKTRSFQGTKAALFDQWGVYKEYKNEILSSSFESSFSKKKCFNPWGIHRETQPGEEKYKKIVSAKENDSLKCAFTSLESEGILTWSEYTMFVPDIQTEADGATITRALTEHEWKKRNQERLEYISELSREENCVLSVETFEAGIGDYEMWNTNYYMNDQQPEQQQANPAEEAMYLNYQAYIRQLTVKMCKKQKGYVPVNQIPNKYEIFSDWKYRRQYLDLDKKYRLQLLGWKSAWSEYQFEVINEAKAAKYDKGNAQDLALRLAVEYISYMETQMDKDCIYFAEGYADDFIGLINGAGSNRWFSIRKSKSGNKLHDRLKELYMK